MRQIKFRGVCIEPDSERADEMIYGKAIWQWLGVTKIKADKDGIAYQVDRNSVQQLIAVDINGREVYEGDLVERIADYDDEDFDPAKAFPMAATFDDFSAINDGQIIRAEAHHDD